MHVGIVLNARMHALLPTLIPAQVASWLRSTLIQRQGTREQASLALSTGEVGQHPTGGHDHLKVLGQVAVLLPTRISTAGQRCI